MNTYLVEYTDGTSEYVQAGSPAQAKVKATGEIEDIIAVKFIG